MGTGCVNGQVRSPETAEDLFDAMQIETGSWAADVGCGDGDYTLPMARRVGDAGRVFAVDVSANALDELNEKIARHNVETITTVYSIEDNPMLPVNAFDALLVRNAYHHFTAPESMLRHMKASLKPGGRLVITESVDRDMVDASREAQVENHDLGIQYVRQELKAAGFIIQSEVKPFVESDYEIHWLIVATRSKS
jgi:ubiquinone/menaquinone biosynthesis C-methylase UbiE